MTLVQADRSTPLRSILESPDAQLDDLLQRICVKLQLSRTQHELAEARYGAVGKWLAGDSGLLSGLNPDIYPQGSLRIGTTTKPWGEDQEFDLDIVLHFGIEWYHVGNPVSLLDGVERRLKENGTYAPMVERKNRCVRLNYAGDFHMDILPACENSAAGEGCVKVPDRQAVGWKDSNPIGYANWFEVQASKGRLVKFGEYMEPLPVAQTVEQKPPLKRVVQLINRAGNVPLKRRKSTR